MSTKSSPSVRALYRALYRELSSQHVQTNRSQAEKEASKIKALNDYRRKIGKPAAPEPADPHSIKRTSFPSDTLRYIFDRGTASEESIAYGKETLEFLKHQNVYKVLLDRYNPGANMEQDERVRLSAKKVGLDLPEDISRRIY